MKTLISTLLLLCLTLVSRAQCTTPSQPGSIIGIDPVCAGSTQVYYIYPVTGATSYTWTLPNGWTGSSTSTSITVTPGSTGGWIYVTANNNCGSSTAQGYNALVFAAVITASGPVVFCDGDDVQLNATTGNGLFYQWFNNGNMITGATGSTYLASAAGNYTVQISTNNCFTLSSPFTVDVESAPDVPVATNSSPVCAGAAVNFSGNCTTPGVSYQWTGPNNFSSQNPSIIASQATDAGTYTLTVTGTVCSSTSTTEVVIEDIPSISAISGPNPVCEGSTVVYEVANDVSATQYYWSLPSWWNGTSTTNSVTATTDTASGFIHVYAANNCGVSDTAELFVKVNPKPQPEIVVSGNSLTTTQQYTSYQWYSVSGPIPGATGQNHIPTELGNHFVIVTDSNGCVNQSNIFNIDGLSTNSLPQRKDLILYPNPGTGLFAIQGIPMQTAGEVRIEVTDMIGRLVYSESQQVTGSATQLSIDLQGAAPGLYRVTLATDGWYSIIPLVKQ